MNLTQGWQICFNVINFYNITGAHLPSSTTFIHTQQMTTSDLDIQATETSWRMRRRERCDLEFISSKVKCFVSGGGMGRVNSILRPNLVQEIIPWPVWCQAWWPEQESRPGCVRKVGGCARDLPLWKLWCSTGGLRRVLCCWIEVYEFLQTVTKHTAYIEPVCFLVVLRN